MKTPEFQAMLTAAAVRRPPRLTPCDARPARSGLGGRQVMSSPSISARPTRGAAGDRDRRWCSAAPESVDKGVFISPHCAHTPPTARRHGAVRSHQRGVPTRSPTDALGQWRDRLRPKEVSTHNAPTNEEVRGRGLSGRRCSKPECQCRSGWRHNWKWHVHRRLGRSALERQLGLCLFRTE